jgi:hypothetical protein
MEIQRGGITRRAEANPHVSDGFNIGVDHQPVGRAGLDRSKGEAVLEKSPAEADSSLVAEGSGRRGP